jgi:hypothetical protein
VFFAGWYALPEDTLIIGIRRGSIGNLELFAKWSQTYVELPSTLPTPIRNVQKSDNRHGIRFAKSIVSDKAEIFVNFPTARKRRK